ncbi:MAG: hypothetical protein Q9170_004768 [Blastenia crenularia]
MFWQARYQILINCFAKGTPVPPNLTMLTEKMAVWEDAASRPLSLILNMMTRVCDLRATITSFSPSEVVVRCETLDGQLAAWPLSCPSAPLHIAMKSYSSYSIAWNLYRCLRILINGLILEYSSEQSRSKQAEKGHLVIQLCSDICASAEIQINHAAQLRVCDALSLVWPLTVAAIAQQKINHFKAFELLEYMGRTTGINQCLSVTHTIRSIHNGSTAALEKRDRAFGAMQARRLPSI